MSNDVSIGYLTGTAKVIKNNFNYDSVEWRKRRTVKQMFFQPYESKEEFIACARHTSFAMINLGLMIIDPILTVVVPAVITAASVACLTGAGISKLCGSKGATSVFLDMAEYLMKDLIQAVIDIVVLPLSAATMLTRGTSTILHAAGAFKPKQEKAPEIDESAPVISAAPSCC